MTDLTMEMKYRAQRGKADWPPRPLARPRGGVRASALAVSEVNPC